MISENFRRCGLGYQNMELQWLAESCLPSRHLQTLEEHSEESSWLVDWVKCQDMLWRRRGAGALWNRIVHEWPDLVDTSRCIRNCPPFTWYVSGLANLHSPLHPRFPFTNSMAWNGVKITLACFQSTVDQWLLISYFIMFGLVYSPRILTHSF